MSELKILRSLALTASLVLASGAARAAEPTAADVESAQALYKEGKALREHGDLAPALEKFRAAHALVETPITALDLGRTYVALGKLVEAREVLAAVARIPVRKNETQRATEARATADALAAELRPKLASLTAKLRGAEPGSAPPKISVDGVAVPPEAATSPRIVNPGRHLVVLEANGQKTQVEVVLAEGQSKDVPLDVPKPAPRAAGPAAGPTEPGKRSPLVYVGFGTAIVGVAVGAVTGILTFSAASSVKDACRSNGSCPASERSHIDTGGTTGTISTIAFIIGGAGVAVGVIGLALGRSSPSGTSQASAYVGPAGAGLRGSF